MVRAAKPVTTSLDRSLVPGLLQWLHLPRDVIVIIMLRALSVTGPAHGSVEAGGGAGEGGVGRRRQGGWARAGGGGGNHGDPEGVVVTTATSSSSSSTTASLGLLQDVLGVVHGDQAGVGDEVRESGVV